MPNTIQKKKKLSFRFVKSKKKKPLNFNNTTNFKHCITTNMTRKLMVFTELLNLNITRKHRAINVKALKSKAQDRQ